jgi:hypothetical protein
MQVIHTLSDKAFYLHFLAVLLMCQITLYDHEGMTGDKVPERRRQWPI